MTQPGGRFPAGRGSAPRAASFTPEQGVSGWLVRSANRSVGGAPLVGHQPPVFRDLPHQGPPGKVQFRFLRVFHRAETHLFRFLRLWAESTGRVGGQPQLGVSLRIVGRRGSWS